MWLVNGVLASFMLIGAIGGMAYLVYRVTGAMGMDEDARQLCATIAGILTGVCIIVAGVVEIASIEGG